jgi:hypothetical protein
MIAFVHINKTAGTNLKYLLRRSFGGKHCDVRLWPPQSKSDRETKKRVLTAKDLRNTKWIYPSLKSIAGHNVTSYSDLSTIEGLRFYTFLREPIARTASHYQFMLRHDPNLEPFEEWIKKSHYRNVQTRKIAGEANAVKAIEIIKKDFGFVGLSERYDESLLLFKKWANEPSLDVRYNSLNVAAKTGKASSLLTDPATLELMKDANSEDLKLYDFVVNEIYPPQVKAYGAYLEQDLLSFIDQNKVFKKRKSNRGKIQRGLYWTFLPWISRGSEF